MKKALDLSPFGTAREAITGASPAPLVGSLAESELLSWFRKIREPLKALYGIEDEIALIVWELLRAADWAPGCLSNNPDLADPDLSWFSFGSGARAFA